jgi:hypothetical protein
MKLLKCVIFIVSIIVLTGCAGTIYPSYGYSSPVYRNYGYNSYGYQVPIYRSYGYPGGGYGHGFGGWGHHDHDGWGHHGGWGHH